MHEADETNLTWAGRRLLKPRYLDELPQIWNVFRGDMSLVGPRPWPPPMVANQVAKGFTYRNEFIAGWTGPAQVEKGVTEPAGYAVLDVAYVDRMPDVRTAWRIVRRRSRGSLADGRRDGERRRSAVLNAPVSATPSRKYGSIVHPYESRPFAIILRALGDRDERNSREVAAWGRIGLSAVSQDAIAVSQGDRLIDEIDRGVAATGASAAGSCAGCWSLPTSSGS